LSLIETTEELKSDVHLYRKFFEQGGDLYGEFPEFSCFSPEPFPPKPPTPKDTQKALITKNIPLPTPEEIPEHCKSPEVWLNSLRD
jgi:hypothetical protein